jgi:hypothetical protein
MSLIFVRKQTKVHDFLLDAYLRPPLFCASHPANSKKTRCVRGLRPPPVFRVCTAIHDAQIRKPVVRAVAVDVIDLTCGPLAVVQKPSNPMARVVFAVDVKINVALDRMNRASNFTNADTVARSLYPGYQTGHGVDGHKCSGYVSGESIFHTDILTGTLPMQPDYSLRSTPAKPHTIKLDAK